MASERAKMLAGEVYDPTASELTEARMLARDLRHAINQRPPRNDNLRRKVFKKITR